jgi:2-methylcitrate dehydratase PrpD
VEYVKGHPKNPMTIEEVIEKFQNCLRFSPLPIEQKNINDLILSVRHLEEEDDVRRLIGLLIA